MTGQKVSMKFILNVALLWGLSLVSAQAEFDKAYTKVSESTSAPSRVNFEYRLTPYEEVESVTVKADGQELFPKLTSYVDNKTSKSAILFLIDTSNSRRSREIDRAKKLVLSILSKADEDRHIIGVYPFHGQLNESFAPLGSSLKEVTAKIKTLKADGVNTMLYGSTLKAIGLLQKVKAERKSIVVISDWKSEDNVIGTKEFVLEAEAQLKKGGIVCYSIILAEEDQSEIDTADQLSEVNGGFTLKVNKAKLVLPETLPMSLLDGLENGGAAEVDLAGREQSKEIVLEVKTKGGKAYRQVYDRTEVLKKLNPEPPVEPEPATPEPDDVDAVPDEPVIPEVELELDEEPEPEVEPESEEEPKEEGFMGLPVWMLSGIALLVVIFAGLGAILLRKKEEVLDEPGDFQTVEDGADSFDVDFANLEDTEVEESEYVEQFELGNGSVACRTLPTSNDKVVAILEFGKGGSRGKYPIFKNAVRIGRGQDNDLTINNDSVSRHHAELLCKRDGTFSITDLDSGNKVHLNGEEVSQSDIVAGDSVEIGEVMFTFLPVSDSK